MSKPRAKKPSTLVRAISKLYMSELYSDMEVRSREKRYPVHRAIVCPQSRWFEAACGERFREGADGVISLPEDDPQAIDIMIWQFYHQDYSVLPHRTVTAGDGDKSHESSAEGSKHADDEGALLVHVKVYALAEKLCVPGLKVLALRKFKDVASQHWASEIFLLAVGEAYTTIPEPDRGLRDAISDTFYQHQELLDMPAARDLVKEVNDLAADLVVHFHERNNGHGGG